MTRYCAGRHGASTTAATIALASLVMLIGNGSARDTPHQESTPSVFGPVFIAPVGNQTAAIGKEAVFSCSVGNIGKYKVGWLRDSDQMILSLHTKTVIQNARFAVTYETGGSSGAIGNSGSYGVTGSSQEEIINGTWKLHIRQLKESDKGCYMCQVNTDPMKSELGCLDILVPPDIDYGTETSADLSVSEGENATLSCRATGRPKPRVSWKREDNTKILLRSSGGGHFNEVDVYNGSLLHFYRVDRRQMGTYFCIASNDVPPAVSKRVTLAVNFAPVVQAQNQLLGAPPGTDVELECYVEAYPHTINYWTKNKSEILLDGKKYTIREKRSSYRVWMHLTIHKFSKEDAGNYKCVSTNSLGKVEGSLRLYEIAINGNDGLHGKNHVSILGGLAEAARGSGASGRNFRDTKHYSLVFYTISFVIPLFELRPR